MTLKVCVCTVDKRNCMCCYAVVLLVRIKRSSKHYKCSAWFTSFNLDSNLGREVLLFPQCCRLGNCGTERLDYPGKSRQLIMVRAGYEGRYYRASRVALNTSLST